MLSKMSSSSFCSEPNGARDELQLLGREGCFFFSILRDNGAGAKQSRDPVGERCQTPSRVRRSVSDAAPRDGESRAPLGRMPGGQASDIVWD